MEKSYRLPKCETSEEYKALKASVFSEIVNDFKEFQTLYLESTEAEKQDLDFNLKTKGTYELHEQALVSMQVTFDFKKAKKEDSDKVEKPSKFAVTEAKEQLEKIRKQRELNFAN